METEAPTAADIDAPTPHDQHQQSGIDRTKHAADSSQFNSGGGSSSHCVHVCDGVDNSPRHDQQDAPSTPEPDWDGKTLAVANVPPAASVADLSTAFGVFGAVAAVDVLSDSSALVRYRGSASAEAMLLSFQVAAPLLHGAPLQVEPAVPGVNGGRAHAAPLAAGLSQRAPALPPHVLPGNTPACPANHVLGAAPWAGRAVSVGDIPLHATPEDLRAAFEHVGRVVTAHFSRPFRASVKGGIVVYTEYGACARMLQAVAQGARVCVLGQSVTVALFTGKQALSGSRLGGAGVGMPPQPPLTQPFAMPTARQAPEAAPWAGRAVFVGDIPLEATVGSLTKAFEHVGQVETARFCLTYSHALKKGGIIAYREPSACARMLQAVARGERTFILGQPVVVAPFMSKQGLAGRLGGLGVSMPPQMQPSQAIHPLPVQHAGAASSAPWAGRALFVANIPVGVTNNGLCEAFAQAGQVETTQFCRYKHGTPYQCGIIVYREPDACRRMLDAVGSSEHIFMLGRMLHVAPFELKQERNHFHPPGSLGAGSLGAGSLGAGSLGAPPSSGPACAAHAPAAAALVEPATALGSACLSMPPQLLPPGQGDSAAAPQQAPDTVPWTERALFVAGVPNAATLDSMHAAFARMGEVEATYFRPYSPSDPIKCGIVVYRELSARVRMLRAVGSSELIAMLGGTLHVIPFVPKLMQDSIIPPGTKGAPRPSAPGCAAAAAPAAAALAGLATGLDSTGLGMPPQLQHPALAANAAAAQQHTQGASRQGRALFVAGIPGEATVGSVRVAFAHVGEVASVSFFSRRAGAASGCAMVVYREPRACTRMLESMGGLQRIPMLGRLLYVAPYEPKADAVCQY